MGPPGSGKDTQAELLATSHGFHVVSTGDLFRREVQTGSELGTRLNEVMSRGELVSDDLVFSILRKFLAADSNTDLIFTGTVRTSPQIELMDNVLSETGRKLDYVVSFTVPDIELIQRISERRVCPVDGSTYHLRFAPPKQEGLCDKCGARLVQRADAKPEAVEARLKDYHLHTKDILKSYADRGILVEVDARPPIQEVAKDLQQKLKLNE